MDKAPKAPKSVPDFASFEEDREELVSRPNSLPLFFLLCFLLEILLLARLRQPRLFFFPFPSGVSGSHAKLSRLRDSMGVEMFFYYYVYMKMSHTHVLDR